MGRIATFDEDLIQKNLLSFPFDRRGPNEEYSFDDSYLPDDPLEDLMNEFAYVEDNFEDEEFELEEVQDSFLNSESSELLLNMVQIKLDRIKRTQKKIGFFLSELNLLRER